MSLTHRRATSDDLLQIVHLLFDDILGKTREIKSTQLDARYLKAFNKIDTDPNQYLMVVEQDNEIVATCHLTLMPSLTCMGATRMQIEAVRVAENRRNQKIGEWMLKAAIAYAKVHDVLIIQLTTNKKRHRAKQFYERLGFVADHEGMKMSLSDEN